MGFSWAPQTETLRLGCLVVGCLMVSGSGPIIGFNVYATPLKDAFNYTQSDLELCASLINLGHKMGFPAGVLQEYIGSRALSGVASLMTAAAWTMLYLTLKYQATLSSSPIVVGVYLFFVGFSGISAFMSAVPINFDNFAKKKRGKIVACLEGCYSISPMFVAIIFAYAYMSPDGDNLLGFFLLQACSWALIFMLGTVFLNIYSPESDELTEESGLVRHEISISDDHVRNNNDKIWTCPKNINENIYKGVVQSEYSSIWGWPLVKDIDFQLFMWSFIIFVGLQTVYLNNLTSFVISYGYYKNTQIYTILAPFFTALSLFITGPISDRIAPTMPRSILLLIAHVIMTLSFLILLFQGGNQVAFFFAMIGIEAGAGMIFCVGPTLVSETYGVHYFGRNWGGILIGTAISGAIFQSLFGYYYDRVLHHQSYQDPLYCFGPLCYVKALIILAIVAVVGVAFDIVLLKRHFKRYRNYDSLVEHYSRSASMETFDKFEVEK